MDFFTYFYTYSYWALLILRVGVGIIFLVHGFAKWKMFQMQPSEQMSAGMINMMRFLAVMEPLGGLAMILGFLTQPAAIGLGLIMLGAIYFKTQKWHIPFMTNTNTGWEYDFLILCAVAALFFLGAGNFSLDTVVFRL